MFPSPIPGGQGRAWQFFMEIRVTRLISNQAIINPVSGLVELELTEGNYQGDPEDEFVAEEMVNKLLEDNWIADGAVDTGTLQVLVTTPHHPTRLPH
jgi:hypothetical protein